MSMKTKTPGTVALGFFGAVCLFSLLGVASSYAAEGDLDFKGTLGVSKEVAVGFKTIRLEFNLDSDATTEQIESLKKLTERYCVVYQTLIKGVTIETQFHLS